MSRSGYSDDCEYMDLWRANVERSIHGKRGQQLLRDLLAALDEMPVKALVAEALVTADGEHCTLGVLGHKQGLNITDVDPEDYEAVAKTFGVAQPLVQEIAYENDEAWGHRNDTPEERWTRMRAWVASHIRPSLEPKP